MLHTLRYQVCSNKLVLVAGSTLSYLNCTDKRNVFCLFVCFAGYRPVKDTFPADDNIFLKNVFLK